MSAYKNSLGITEQSSNLYRRKTVDRLRNSRTGCVSIESCRLDFGITQPVPRAFSARNSGFGYARPARISRVSL